MMSRSKAIPFAVCVCNEGSQASLGLRKIYQVVPDARAQRFRLVKVIDESGKDYLYPETFFVIVELPKAVAQTLAR